MRFVYVYVGELSHSTYIALDDHGQTWEVDGEVLDLMAKVGVNEGGAVKLDNCHTHSAFGYTKEELAGA